MATVARPTIYRKNRGVRYAPAVAWAPAQVKAELEGAFGADVWAQLQALCDGGIVETRFARYSLDAAALESVQAAPLWQQIADPGYFEGTDRRGALAGGR